MDGQLYWVLILQFVDEKDETKKKREEISASNIRPVLRDDSREVPLRDRNIGMQHGDQQLRPCLQTSS